jgi:hypothetical protein
MRLGGECLDGLSRERSIWCLFKLSAACLSVYPPVLLHVYLYVCLSAGLPVGLSACLSVCYLPAYLSTTCLPVYLPV